MDEIKKALLNLEPKEIDYTKCTEEESLYEQILGKSREIDQRQATQFNLGNGQIFHDPIETAKHLLEREYGDTSLIKEDCNEPVFIPDEFKSNQYFKNSPMLNFNIEEKFVVTLNNLRKELPDHWLTQEIERFVQSQDWNKAHDTDTISEMREIKKTDFDKWILNIKILYLVIEDSNTAELAWPCTTIATGDFIQGCITHYKATLSPSLKMKLQKWHSSSLITMKREVKALLMKTPPTDSNLKWLMDVELSERGDYVEQWFFEQISSDDIKSSLKDIVILQSVNFLTDVSTKKHTEYDFVIFSWSRKLIIAIEMKRQLFTETAFKQLDKCYNLFQKQLSDQLGPGWTFHPVICVQKDRYSFQNLHYINTQTDIKLWIESLLKRHPQASLKMQTPLIHPLEQLKKVLQIIIFTIHVSKKNQPAPITTTKLVDHINNVIDSLSKGHTVAFYSKQQLPVFQNYSFYNKLIITGGFGTGKTFLLQEKAIQLSKDINFKGKILYVIFRKKMLDTLPTLLYYERLHILKSSGIKIKEFASVDEINQLIKEDIKAVFIDEWDGKMENLSSDPLVLWIATKVTNQNIYRYSVHFSLKNDFKFIHLSINLRNTKEISNKSKSVGEEAFYEHAKGLADPPKIFPKGNTPITKESIEEAITLAQSSTAGGILVVSDKIEKPQNITGRHVKFYHSDTNNDFINSSTDPYKFLLQGNILFTSPKLLSGFEWTTVIYDVRGLPPRLSPNKIMYHKCNIISRCKASLYIVGEHYHIKREEFSYSDVLKTLETANEDNQFLYLFKQNLMESIQLYIKKNPLGHDWFKRFLPILRNSVKQLSKSNTETMTKSKYFEQIEKVLSFIVIDRSVLVYGKTDTATAIATLHRHIIRQTFLNDDKIDHWFKKHSSFYSILDEDRLFQFLPKAFTDTSNEDLKSDLIKSTKFLIVCIGVTVILLKCNTETKRFFENDYKLWNDMLLEYDQDRETLKRLHGKMKTVLQDIKNNKFTCFVFRGRIIKCVERLQSNLKIIA